MILVPSMATLPSFTNPAFWHRRSACTNKPASAPPVFTAEVADSVVIGMLVGGQITERHVVVGGALDTAGTRPDTIAIEQQTRQQQRMIGRQAPAIVAFILSVDGREIQLVDHVGDEASQMVFRKPILEGSREQKRLIEDRGCKP